MTGAERSTSIKSAFPLSRFFKVPEALPSVRTEGSWGSVESGKQSPAGFLRGVAPYWEIVLARWQAIRLLTTKLVMALAPLEAGAPDASTPASS